MDDLDAVFARASGSRLISYAFESKELRFQLYQPARGELLAFAVPTDTVHARSVPDDPVRATCRVETFELSLYMPVLRGRYVPPPDIDRFVDHARDRLSLAYGRRPEDCRWLLALRGAYPLLACLVRDLADVRWSVE